MRKSPVTLAIAAGVAALALAACGSSGSNQPSGTPSYSSASAVILALGKGGLPVTYPQYSGPAKSDPVIVVSGATSEASGWIDGSGTGELVMIDTFPASYHITRAEVIANSASTGDQQIYTVYGPDWWVQTDSAHAQTVQSILGGGQIVAGPWTGDTASGS